MCVLEIDGNSFVVTVDDDCVFATDQFTLHMVGWLSSGGCLRLERGQWRAHSLFHTQPRTCLLNMFSRTYHFQTSKDATCIEMMLHASEKTSPYIKAYCESHHHSQVKLKFQTVRNCLSLLIIFLLGGGEISHMVVYQLPLLRTLAEKLLVLF